jgi:hypothetical protein
MSTPTRRPGATRSASSSAAKGSTKRSAGTASARKASTGQETDAGSGDSYRASRLATSRYGIVYDIDGPRVRLGVAWFVAALVAILLGIVALAILVAAIAALAGAQTAQALRTKWRRPDLAVSALIAAAIPLAAAIGTGLAGLAVVLGSIVAVATAGPLSKRRRDPLIDAAAVVRSSVFVGLAAASIVMLYRFDIGAAVTILLMASAYESGDYLIGSGASNTVEGPFSGVLAIVFVTGVLAVAQPPPFAPLGLWFYAAVVALSVPVGQVLAAAILPRAGASAPALRRLDSYLFAGPVWLVLLWCGIGVR